MFATTAWKIYVGFDTNVDFVGITISVKLASSWMKFPVTTMTLRHMFC